MSLLPFGGLFSFLFGTANDGDVTSMKKDIQKLYDNQIGQSKVLNDVISIANISRGLINVNIMKINQIISIISFLNDTMDSFMNQLKPLFTARRFLLLHTKSLIHHSRIRSLLRKMKTNTALFKAYLKIHITGRLNPIYHRSCTSQTGTVKGKQTVIYQTFPTQRPTHKCLALLQIPYSNPCHPWK